MLFRSCALRIADDLYLSTSPDLLRRTMESDPPARTRLIVGYAGWGAGQLEEELQASAWLLSEVDASLLFNHALGIAGLQDCRIAERIAALQKGLQDCRKDCRKFGPSFPPSFLQSCNPSILQFLVDSPGHLQCGGIGPQLADRRFPHFVRRRVEEQRHVDLAQ